MLGLASPVRSSFLLGLRHVFGVWFLVEGLRNPVLENAHGRPVGVPDRALVGEVLLQVEGLDDFILLGSGQHVFFAVLVERRLLRLLAGGWGR